MDHKPQMDFFEFAPLKYYNFTQLAVFSRCPFEYYHRYIISDSKLPYSKDIVLGKLLHRIISNLFMDPLPNRISDNIIHLVEKEWNSDIFNNKEDSIKWKKIIVTNLIAFAKNPATFGDVIFLEKKFKTRIESFGIYGRIDLVIKDADNNYSLIEVKLSQYMFEQQMSADLQLYFYNFGLENQYHIKINKMFFYILENNSLSLHQYDKRTAELRLKEIKEIIYALENIKEYMPKKNYFCDGCGCTNICPLSK